MMAEKRSCLIITGGTLDLAFARSFLERGSFAKVIAVDGGLEAADALGIVPDYIVGDFDTAERAVLEKYRQMPFIVGSSISRRRMRRIRSWPGTGL